MLRRFWPWTLSLVLVAIAAFAQEKKPPDVELARIKPLAPDAAVKSFELSPGFHVELVAAEPLIASPVAVDFDESGRLFVAEYSEYNQYALPPETPKTQGRVKLLVDTDGDGRFDRSTVYADRLDAPVAVACWDGGVFVGAVPDVWYLKDTNGDGVADVRRKVLTGFDRDRAGEGMMNSFRWTPDNRLLISTGLAGGNLRHADRPKDPPVSIRRQNIRFDPRTETFELTSGGGQHGLSLDDWGDTFVCGNSHPFQHLAYDARYLARNPYVQAPPPVVDVNAAGQHPNLHRISPPEPWREARTRLRKDKLVPGSDEGGQPFGFFTGATGVTVYRGDAFPAEYHGNAFVGEVANNLVYRAKLEPKGLGWSAVRAEKDREFLASRDVWFRPVQFANAPDGTLYVVDMYRELIEGAAFLPPQVLKHVDVAGGIDRGRIYRIVPDGFQQRKLPDLGKATTSELVALLEHPNGWHRDTAARLLYQRQDRSAVEELKKLASGSKSALGRMHARYALEGLPAFTVLEVLTALRDPDARMREHALRGVEKLGMPPGLMQRLEALAQDPEPRVRYQLAFSLGALRDRRTAKLLATLARKDGENPWMRLAILSSVNDRAGDLFAELLGDSTFRGTPGGKLFLAALAGQVAAAKQQDAMARVVAAVNTLPDAETDLTRDLVKSFVLRLPTSERAKFTGLAEGKTAKVIADLLASAHTTAADEKAAPADRAAALRTLGLTSFREAKAALTSALHVRQPQPVQTAALEVLARFDESDVPRIILEQWQGMSPQIRATAAETLLARPAWVDAFLDAVEKGTVRPTDLDPARVQLLQKSADDKVRARAAKLFAGVSLSKRQDVIAKYQKALEAVGDAAKGKALFKEHCSACHKLEGVGQAIGPDLSAIKDRGLEAVMANILDPNREVLPQYYTYVLSTDDGVTLAGMIAGESANTVTIFKPDGTSETVQRVNIESLRSSGLSAMPEGFEEKIDLAGMADLLSYFRSIR